MMNDSTFIDRMVIMREILESQAEILPASDYNNIIDEIAKKIVEKDSYVNHELNLLKNDINGYISSLEQTVAALEDIDIYTHPEDNIYYVGQIKGRINAFKLAITLAKKYLN